MSFHHLERLIAHADLTALTPTETLVAFTIAKGINAAIPTKMRHSTAYLMEQTGRNENSVLRATEGLISRGIFSRERGRAREAYLYTLLVTCPDDCTVSKHKTKEEKALERESVIGAKALPSIALNKDENNYLSDTQTPQNGGTNTELIQTNTDAESSSVFVSLSLETYKDLLVALVANDPSPIYRELLNDAEGSHLLASHYVENKQPKNPRAYVNSILRKSPETFQTARPTPKTDRATHSTAKIDDYFENVVSDSGARRRFTQGDDAWNYLADRYRANLLQDQEILDVNYQVQLGTFNTETALSPY